MRKALLLLTLLCIFTSQAASKWELSFDLPSAHAVFATSHGNIVASDFDYLDYNGGIYISEDNGETWSKTNAADYCYSNFYEAGDYVFATGEKCRIARSNDGGKTWEILNYAYALKGIVTDEELDYTQCHTMAYYKGRLYIADFNGGGVLYSEDYGESWEVSDRESLMYKDQVDGKDYMDNLYNLVVFNDQLYLFGGLFVFRFNDETECWDVMRNDSNFMVVSTIYNNKLVCGRAIENETFNANFLEFTSNGESWAPINRPEGQKNNYIRALAADDNNLYAALLTKGIYYTSDMGRTWIEIFESLPTNKYDSTQYLAPLKMAVSGDYLFAAIFEVPMYDDRGSGIYRIKISELPTAGVEHVENAAYKVYADHNYLYVGRDDAQVVITNITGIGRPVVLDNGRVDISNYPAGVYVYTVVANGNRTTGKFVK